ncbi:MAG TPA: substrate-binding domain-containing protein, partial [Ktedonobacteraceae bacterium]
EQSYAEDMWAQGIRAIIFGSSSLSLTHLFGLVERGLHTITFDRHTLQDDYFDVDSVSIDNMLAGRLATEHLITLGHRRISLLSGPIRTVSRIDRLKGYRAALTDAGIPVDPQLIWEATPDSPFGDIEGATLGRMGAREVLSLEDPPTAIIGINDLYALGAYAGANDVGLSIPSTCSIIGFDDIMFAEIAQPPLTTIRQPLQEMLRVAVERLIERLEKADDSGSTVHHTFAPELIIRGSTGPAPT